MKKPSLHRRRKTQKPNPEQNAVRRIEPGRGLIADMGLAAFAAVLSMHATNHVGHQRGRADRIITMQVCTAFYILALVFK